MIICNNRSVYGHLLAVSRHYDILIMTGRRIRMILSVYANGHLAALCMTRYNIFMTMAWGGLAASTHDEVLYNQTGGRL